MFWNKLKYSRLIAFAVLLATVYSKDCKKGWKSFDDSCYIISTVKRDWKSSKAFCESIQSALADVNTREERDFLKDLTLNYWTIANTWIRSAYIIWDDSLMKVSTTTRTLCPTLLEGTGQDQFMKNTARCDRQFYFVCERNQTLSRSSKDNQAFKKGNADKFIPFTTDQTISSSSVDNSTLKSDSVDRSEPIMTAVPLDCYFGRFGYKNTSYLLLFEPKLWYPSMTNCKNIGLGLTRTAVNAYDVLKDHCTQFNATQLVNICLSKNESILSLVQHDHETLNSSQCIIAGIRLEEITNCEVISLPTCEKSGEASGCKYLLTGKLKPAIKADETIEDLYTKVINSSSDYDTVDILVELEKATSAYEEHNATMSSDRLLQVVEIITNLAEGSVLNNQTSVAQNSLKSYLGIVSNLIGEHTVNSWDEIIDQTGKGANLLLDGVELFMTNRLNDTEYVAESTDNTFALKSPVGEQYNEIVFPNLSDMGVPDWISKTKNRIVLKYDTEYTSSSYIGVIFNNAEFTYPSTFGPERNLQRKLNSDVIAFSLKPKLQGTLKSPVEILFQALKNDLDNPKCVYWKNNDRLPGYWSSDSCWLHQYIKQDGVVVCKCNHLSHFSVLMSLSTELISEHEKALRIITQTGLIISTVFLALTVIVYILSWRYIKSTHSVMKLNLSCVLFLANLLFLTGIDKTANKVVCTVIAACLHLLYLIVFFVMLAVGLDMLYMVSNPYHIGHNTTRNLLASYGAAVIVVAVSMGSVQFEGYGTDKHCWLSTETGLIWAFLAPVLVIVFINVIIVAVVFKIMFSTTKMARKTHFSRVKSGIRGFIVLLPVMGLTWIFGIFTYDENSVVFHYLFSIFNSLQGFFIFMNCVMNEKIREAVEKLRPTCVRSSVADTKTSRV